MNALRLSGIEQVLDEEAAKSEQFKRVLENWRAFRAEQHHWFLPGKATSARQLNPPSRSSQGTKCELTGFCPLGRL